MVSRNSYKGVDRMNKENLRLDRRMTEADAMRYNVGLNTPINDRQKIEAIFDEVVDLQAQLSTEAKQS